jgi:branched-chain amino acid transport system substrate-binding protein
MKSRLIFLVVALVAAMMAAGAGASAVAGPTYEIDAIISLTGQAAFIGAQESQALQAYETVVNRTGGIHGRPVHFAIDDDQSNPAIAVQLANAIIAKNVSVILGPDLTATCRAVMPLTTNGPVAYCFSPAIDPERNTYMFSSGPSTQQNIAATLRYFSRNRWKRIALIASTDATGQHGTELVEQTLHQREFADMTLAAEERFADGDVSVGAQVARVKAAQPQAIIAWTTGTPTGTVLHGLHDAGLDLPVMLNAGNILRAQLRDYGSFVPSRLTFTGVRFMASSLVRPGPVSDAQREFADGLRARGVAPPEISNDIAWTPAKIVVEALRRLPEHATAADVKNYIEALHGFAVPDNLMDFRDGSQRGVPQAAVVIVRWIPLKAGFEPVSQPGGAPLPTATDTHPR